MDAQMIGIALWVMIALFGGLVVWEVYADLKLADYRHHTLRNQNARLEVDQARFQFEKKKHYEYMEWKKTDRLAKAIPDRPQYGHGIKSLIKDTPEMQGDKP